MSQKIDPREVLIYLNELGYTNINAQQLKEFITDLKKLIKYEYKHRKENIEHANQLPNSTTYDSTYSSNTHYNPNNQINLTEDNQNQNVFDSLYKKPTVSSRAKEIPKRERQISVHITKARNRNIIHDHCVHLGKEYNVDERHQGSEVQWGTDVGSTNGGSQLLVVTEASIKSIEPDSLENLIDKSKDPNLGPKDPILGSLGKSGGTKVANSRSTFMKSSYSKPINRCDPVALYHHYQREWKKQKFPGQETHSDLRWAVREKLLRGPKIVYSRSTSSSRNRPKL